MKNKEALMYLFNEANKKFNSEHEFETNELMLFYNQIEDALDKLEKIKTLLWNAFNTDKNYVYLDKNIEE